MLAVRNRAIDGAGLSPTRFAALPAATGAFTSRLSARRSPFPPLDITTAVTGPPLLAGLAPAGMTTSLAARSPRFPGDPSCAFASFQDPGRTDASSPLTVSSMLPPLLTQQGLQRISHFGAIAPLQHLLP